jgi:hypothetical protein
MANRCYIDVGIIGSEHEVANAEADLRSIFSFVWDEETKQQADYGVMLALSYPWGPPADELEEVFEKHSGLIFLTEFWEDGMGFRGRWVWAYGYEIAFAGGPFGPDGTEFYDEVAPLPDILTPWRDPSTRKAPAQVADQFKDKAGEIEVSRQARKARIAAKEQRRQFALAEVAARDEAERLQQAKEAEQEALRVKLESELQAAEDAELALSHNEFTPPRPIEQVVSFLDHYPRLAYCDVARKFNWKYDALLRKLRETGQFDEARLQPRPDQPADKALPPGRYTRGQAETFFRERGQDLPARSPAQGNKREASDDK